ncbi:hypothetical protein Dimus_030259 [Dionaea muscipula]
MMGSTRNRRAAAAVVRVVCCCSREETEEESGELEGERRAPVRHNEENPIVSKQRGEGGKRCNE